MSSIPSLRVAPLILALGLLSSRATTARAADVAAAPESAAAFATAGQAAAALEGLRGEVVTARLDYAPEDAGELGIKGYEAKLTDRSDAAARAYVGRLESISRTLTAIEPHVQRLKPDDRIDHAVIASFVNGELRDYRDKRAHLDTIIDALKPYETIESQIVQMNPRDAAQEWDAVASRTEQIPAYLSQLRENLRQAAREKRPIDRMTVEQDGIGSAGLAAQFFAEGLAKDARASLTPGQFAAIQARLEKAGAAAAKAYQDHVEFMKTEILPISQQSFAAGSEEYTWRLRNDYGISETPSQLHQRGLQLAAKIRKQMEDLAAQIDPTKDLPTLMAELAQEHPVDDQELFKVYSEVSDRARDFVIEKRLFDIPADYKLKIIATPPGMRSSIASAAYFVAPPLDPEKKGAFMVTPSEGDSVIMEGHSYGEIVATVVHEAFPGHDLQFYMFQKNPSISLVRHLLGSDINVEGYALYAEELMRRHGFYTPKEEMMQLKMQLFRAYRIAIDAALHTGGMSRAEAARILEQEAFIPRPSAVSEAYRYSIDPLQAISYMLGRLEIETLKAEYQKLKGERFNEAEFHQEFLSFGPIPPSMIAPAMLAKAATEQALTVR